MEKVSSRINHVFLVKLTGGSLEQVHCFALHPLGACQIAFCKQK